MSEVTFTTLLAKERSIRDAQFAEAMKRANSIEKPLLAKIHLMNGQIASLKATIEKLVSAVYAFRDPMAGNGSGATGPMRIRKLEADVEKLKAAIVLLKEGR